MRLPREPVRASDRSADRTRGASPTATAPGLMLALQGSAGNRAVTSLVARDEADAAVPVDAKPEQRIPARLTSRALGTVQVLSFSYAQPGGTVRRGSEGGDEHIPRDLDFITRHGPHSAALARLGADGESIDADVVIEGMGILHLQGASVYGYRTSGGKEQEAELMEEWGLRAASARFERK